MQESNYNNQKTYHDKIEPLVREVKTLCTVYRLPMFFTCAVANSEKATDYMTEIVLSGAERKILENRIANAILYMNGFQDSIPRNVAEAVDVLIEYIAKTNPENMEILNEPLTDDKIDAIRMLALGRHTLAVPKPEENTIIASDDDNGASDSNRSKKQQKKS